MTNHDEDQADSHADEASHDGPPPPPEPHTPMWLPALGALLFLAVGIVWALGCGDSKADANAPPAESATH